MRGLTIEQVLFLHARLIEETGGAHGVRDLSLLKSAVARPWATFGGRDLYPDLFSKAAALMDSLIHNHPFVDGNKRTGDRRCSPLPPSERLSSHRHERGTGGIHPVGRRIPAGHR